MYMHIMTLADYGSSYLVYLSLSVDRFLYFRFSLDNRGVTKLFLILSSGMGFDFRCDP